MHNLYKFWIHARAINNEHFSKNFQHLVYLKSNFSSGISNTFVKCLKSELAKVRISDIYSTLITIWSARTFSANQGKYNIQSTSEIWTSLALRCSTFGPVPDGSVFGQCLTSEQKISIFGCFWMSEIRTCWVLGHFLFGLLHNSPNQRRL